MFALAKNWSNLWAILTGCQKNECQTIYKITIIVFERVSEKNIKVWLALEVR